MAPHTAAKHTRDSGTRKFQVQPHTAAKHTREEDTNTKRTHKTHTHEQQRPHQKRTHAHIQQHYQLSSSHRRQIGDRAGMAIAHHAGIDPNFFATGGFADANPSMLMVITTAALHQHR